MDIMALSGFVPHLFKYLSTADIIRIPFIGTGMQMAKHVFLHRDSVQSTLEVAEDTVDLLQHGNIMVVFVECSGSPDGRLRAFNKGAFQMAKPAGVKVVPVSLGYVHRYTPGDAVAKDVLHPRHLKFIRPSRPL